MNRSADIFARVYSKIADTVLDIDVSSVKDNGGKLMNLILGAPSLKAIIDDAKTMIALIQDFISGDYRDISWATVGTSVLALVYLIAPVDLIPDFLPVIGLADDLFIFRIALAFIQDDLEQYADWKHNSDIPEAEVANEEEVILDDKIEATE